MQRIPFTSKAGTRPGLAGCLPVPRLCGVALAAVLALQAIAGQAAHAASPATPQSAHGPLSLRDAVDLALARHPDIARAQAEVAQGAAQVGEAGAAWYPKLEYGVRPGYGGGYGANGNRAATRASLGVSQLVYDFGRSASRISAAQATLRQKEYQVADSMESVAFQAAATYLELAASQDVNAAAQRQVDALQQTLGKIVERVRAGLSLSSDRNVAELALLRAQAAAMKADMRYGVAAARFKELTGVRPPRVEPLDEAAARLGAPGHGGGDMEQTPAVRAAAAAVDAADARLRLADAERLPSISVGVNRALSTGRADATNDRWLGVQLTGSFSFGGLNRYQRAAADAALRASRESLESQRLATRSALEAAETEARGAAARRAGYDKLVALSRASRDLYWQEYMLNKRTLTDVVNPERDIFDAEVESINALADGTLARIKAWAAVGELVPQLGAQVAGRHD